MPFAIYRVAKLKSANAIAGSASHNARTRLTPNANSARTACNRQLLGFEGKIPSPECLLAAWKTRTETARRKPDAVLLQELFCGVSPEFFAHTNEAEFTRRLSEWTQRTLTWLQTEFGDNVIGATLHLDETTPHIAAYVVPLATAKDGSVWLSGKKLFNPVTLAQQQDRYAAALADLGLERGVRGSTAEHRSIRSYYAQVEQSLSQAKPTEGADVVFDPLPPKLLESTTAYAARLTELANEKIRAVSAEAEKNRAAAADAVSARRAEKAQRQTNARIAGELASTRTSLRNLTDLVRDIPLAEVLTRLGWGEGKREGSAWMWRTGDHAISVSGAKWYDHKAGKGGGKAIDLTMHLMSCGFSDAVGWLAGQWSQTQVAAAVRVAADHFAAAAPKRSFEDLWAYFARPDPKATILARDYLVSARGLSSALIEEQIRLGRLHGSFQRQRQGAPRPWCVFRHLDTSGETRGATLRALDDRDGQKRALGNKTTAFFSVGPAILDADELVFVESPIDALSYYQRSLRARVVSVGGSSIPDAALESTRQHTLPITVALDHDPAGEAGWHSVLARVRDWGASFVRRLRRAVPRLLGWEVKDWNELLRAEALEATRPQMAEMPEPAAESASPNDAPLPPERPIRALPPPARS